MGPHSNHPAEVRLARHAMATRFEIILLGDDPIRLRAIGEEALDEVDRIENLLSLYRPHSDIARINCHGTTRPVPVSPELIQLLAQARHLTELSDGAFDPTSGALSRVWGFHHGAGRSPDESELQKALEACGWRWVEIDQEHSSVRLRRPGLILDLGAIGKGYALDRAAGILRENGIANALIQGGTSTVIGLGHSDGIGGWRIALPPSTKDESHPEPVEIFDSSLSISAPSGKGFSDSQGHFRGHVLDPRSGWPVDDYHYAAVMTASATVSDSLSTALLVAGEALIERWRGPLPDLKFWLGPG